MYIKVREAKNAINSYGSRELKIIKNATHSSLNEINV